MKDNGQIVFIFYFEIGLQGQQIDILKNYTLVYMITYRFCRNPYCFFLVREYSMSHSDNVAALDIKKKYFRRLGRYLFLGQRGKSSV